MIDIKNLAYEYPGKRALDDVSLHIAEGSITALVGPNGAGKTTLLRCIAALDEPFSGCIHVDGINVADHPRRVHKVLGYLSDFFGLYGDLTVYQSLVFVARLHQIPEGRIAQQVQWAAALLELLPYMSNRTGTLSRGWRQRMGIAQAIIHRPRLLLLDEPASGLDPEARIALSSLLRGLRNEGMTLVVSSHILAELEDYCTDMLVLREGRVVEYRSSAAHAGEKHRMDIVFLDPADVYVPTIQQAAGFAGDIIVTENKVGFDFTGGEEERAGLLKALVMQGAMISSFSASHQKLQDIYMSLSNERK